MDDRCGQPPRRLGGAFTTDVEQALASVVHEPDRPLNLALLQRANPPRWQAEATMLAHEPRKPWQSYVAVSMPPSAVLRDADEYVALILSWSAAVRPQQGTAGFALVDEIGMAHHRRGAAWQWWERYPGLDCAVFNVQLKPGRYQSVNWLTILGDTVINRLGGLESLQVRLHETAAERQTTPPTVHPYDGGVLIRACELPQLSDRGRGEVHPAYRAVNAALRPGRFEDYPEGPNIHLIDAPRTRNLRQATLDWVRRFDD